MTQVPYDSDDVLAFWRNIVCNEDGSLDRDKVLRELSDYQMILENMTYLVTQLTEGQVTNANVDPDWIISNVTARMQMILNQQISTILDLLENGNTSYDFIRRTYLAT